MRRREFLEVCGLLGIGVPVVACAEPGTGGRSDLRSDLSVLVIGAGAAGMSAGHLLAQRGVEFQILEAGPTHGGRTKTARDFVDFPIPLGAEWLHADEDELAVIVNDDTVSITTELVGYDPDDVLGFSDGELTLGPVGEFPDLKFVGSTWSGFFDEYVVPGIVEQMITDVRVVDIDSTGDRIVVTDAAGVAREADAVIVTVPLTVLRDRDIEFVPDLPADKRRALDEADVWGGIKVFVEFTERFYPTFLAFPNSDTPEGQVLYYDAAHGQRTDANVLGLFAVGAPAAAYQARTGDDLRDHVLAELDAVFDGAASRAFVQYVAQNWNEEPFIRQAYVADGADWRGIRTLGEPIGDRIWFAGDAYTDGEDWSSVHVAARSARTAVDGLLDG